MKSSDSKHNAGTVSIARHEKPLLRGWLHAAATLGAVAVTIGLLLRTTHDLPRFFSVLVFGLSMILLYAVSSMYHIVSWNERTRQLLRAFDHSNIFVLIAGTYTPICVSVLDGRLGQIVLALIWTIAAVGVGVTIFNVRLPRWGSTGLYIGMGWVSLIALPRLVHLLPVPALLLLLTGGILYTIGGLIYVVQRPNPSPRFFGFHEIFHSFVIAGSASFVVVIWGWVVPFANS